MDKNKQSYFFTSYFRSIFYERIGLKLTKNRISYILANLYNLKPHVKYDKKGRHSEYFTFLLEDRLITIVCDADTKHVITCIIETHHTLDFYQRNNNEN